MDYPVAPLIVNLSSF